MMNENCFYDPDQPENHREEREKREREREKARLATVFSFYIVGSQTHRRGTLTDAYLRRHGWATLRATWPSFDQVIAVDGKITRLIGC